MTAEEYNTKTMQDYGWTRHHVGLDEQATMAEIVASVKRFQTSQGLEVDGKVGPVTWRRLETFNKYKSTEEYPDALGFILVGGIPRPVDFISHMCDEDAPLSLVGKGGHSSRTHPPSSVVWHWDAALSAESCYRILKKRGLTTHGVIDNDGTFYQFLDFETHVGWHAGHREVNKRSIGVDVSNAVYTKYQSYYERRWGPRPVINATTNGRDHTLLGYYDAQIETAKKLANFINKHLNIPLVTPDAAAVIDSPGKYDGHIAHYHITAKKWDVAGFPFSYVLEEEE